MKSTKLILILATGLFLLGCAPSAEEKSKVMAREQELADSINMVSSSAAVENNKDSTRKFIRTAELKFKVKSVIKSTYDIENITMRQGGFVTYTNLQSNVDFINNIAISADSSLETTYYTVRNDIVLRVPNTKLDTTLKEISRNIDYLDYRIIKADDVALSILSNNLTQKRAAKNEERITRAIDNRGKRLNETTVAEELLLSKQEDADNAKIANLSLRDQINFSTINLSIYQRQTIKRELISNDKNIKAYEPSFGSKIIDSLISGWETLAAFVVFIIKLWAFLLLGLVVLLLYRQFKRRFGKSN
ncbi:MAG: DUF4349 domain-containing protein [Bacteroidota bacterium]